MGIVDDVSSAASKGIGYVSRGGRKAQLKLEINDLIRRREEVASQLGASLYPVLRNYPELISGREQMLNAIASIDAQINGMQAEIAQIESMQNSNQRICPHCGAVVGTTDVFCFNCGNRLTQQNQAPAQQGTYQGPGQMPNNPQQAGYVNGQPAQNGSQQSGNPNMQQAPNYSQQAGNPVSQQQANAGAPYGAQQAASSQAQEASAHPQQAVDASSQQVPSNSQETGSSSAQQADIPAAQQVVSAMPDEKPADEPVSQQTVNVTPDENPADLASDDTALADADSIDSETPEESPVDSSAPAVESDGENSETETDASGTSTI
ncbi:MAG: zinc ribbon domain-containing protein [Coriobacteriales bacterium]